MQSETVSVRLPDESDSREVRIEFETLPAGTLLYRGRRSRAPAPTQNARWLTRTPEAAQVYGYVDRFRTTRGLKLLRPNDAVTHAVLESVFRAWARKNGTSAEVFDRSFPVRGALVLRDSEFEADDVVLRALCSAVHGNGERMLPDYDGWSTPRMPTPAERTFHHDEVVLCNPLDAVEYVDTIDEDTDPKRELDYAYQRIEAEAAARRKARRAGRSRIDRSAKRQRCSGAFRGLSLLDNDDDDDDDDDDVGDAA